ncbi:hypothetical protein DHEL01_v202111 [Diaporthe helianthi]|uniref:Uncharacterized protein n=1 Tax=Diaporthe helianthi TaxID=158607 RepID=A0A2P5IAF1_DIAHE|nr:hypothetical protein DHEL01_v202111 [Diaporthe helianthi]
MQPYVYLALLAANIASVTAVTLGKSRAVAFEGNVIFGKDTLDDQRVHVEDVIETNCLDLGAKGDKVLTGGFDGQGYHFKFVCRCATSNPKLPFTIHKDNWWSAQVTDAGAC